MDRSQPATLRPYRPDDLPRLLDIAVAAWEPVFAAYRAMLGEELFATAFPDWRAEKRRQIEWACGPGSDVHIVVAEQGGEPVGFITFHLNHATGMGTIGNNAVDPAHQGEGIATRMYEHAQEEMRRAGMVCVKVRTGGDASHAPARRAYEKAGFQRSVPSVDYYRKL